MLKGFKDFIMRGSVMIELSGEEEKIEAALSAAEQGIGELHSDQRRVPEGLQELHRVLQSYGSGPCVN